MAVWCSTRHACIFLPARALAIASNVANQVMSTQDFLDEIYEVQNPYSRLVYEYYGTQFPFWDETAAAIMLDPSIVTNSTQCTSAPPVQKPRRFVSPGSFPEGQTMSGQRENNKDPLTKPLPVYLDVDTSYSSPRYGNIHAYQKALAPATNLQLVNFPISIDGDKLKAAIKRAVQYPKSCADII